MNILASQFTRGTEHSEVAMLAWLMVQSARLRSVSTDANNAILRAYENNAIAAGVPGFHPDDPHAQRAEQAARAPFIAAHEASVRPEYPIALNDYLKYLHPSAPLDQRLRSQVKDAFHHQRIGGRAGQR